MKIDIASLQVAMDRRDFLCRSVPSCVRCDTEQVQLIDIEPPAAWRCRRCKFRFNREPAPK